jgi:hypothetical protein
MWSGPRNFSTAMMRAFGNRPDTAVTDEPRYAHYLKVTGVLHPGRDAVLAAHHLLPMIDRSWLDRLTHTLSACPTRCSSRS